MQATFCLQPPTVRTESVTYDAHGDHSTLATKNVPIVQTETRTVSYGDEDAVGDLVGGGSRRHQTVETRTVSECLLLVNQPGMRVRCFDVVCTAAACMVYVQKRLYLSSFFIFSFSFLFCNNLIQRSKGIGFYFVIFLIFM